MRGRARPDRPNYIVYASSYDPDGGGSIFLHQLVHALNSLGEEAYLWPWHRPPGRSLDWTSFRHGLRVLRGRTPRAVWEPFAVSTDLNTPLATARDLRSSSIVVYPEVTLGNPLKATNVVRWLLYRPGLRDPYAFTKDEMFFRVGEICDIPEITGGATDLFVWTVNPAYRDEGRSDRAGACYLVRKGANTPRIPETANAVQIDGMSHGEIAEIFNRSTIFYSYDEASFYSQYAALCGCLSVVVPSRYSCREEWVRNHPPGRYGIAYGLDDLTHARATRHLVEGYLRQQEKDGQRTVQRFVDLTQARFQAKTA
ncbi:hypothetical protein [Oricola sp.]|uniref:hypothetical protein n=1 Tax=Oricola sp. TaxID=1979950 RepID=UPI0025F35572|nr:hypothetical protein [Oricola sp.]MCI5074715.1 hypothetical protein [Oricola sp.]